MLDGDEFKASPNYFDIANNEEVTVTVLSLYRHSTVTKPSLYCHYTVTLPSLYRHCNVTSPSLHRLYRHCTIDVPSLHPCCTVTVPSLYRHCAVTGQLTTSSLQGNEMFVKLLIAAFQGHEVKRHRSITVSCVLSLQHHCTIDVRRMLLSWLNTCPSLEWGG